MAEYKQVAPSALVQNEIRGPFPFENYFQRYLAQGDSWFSIGSLFDPPTTSLLLDMAPARSTVVVNCAHPGDELAHMTDAMHDAAFLGLLSDRRTRLPWDALLVSGGGNDLIDAANSQPSADASLRLFLTQAEWGPQDDPSRYLSPGGWNTFVSHLTKVFAALLTQCDQAVHPAMPVVLHTYDYVTPRDAPAAPGVGPWLFKAMNSYAIPDAPRQALADLLIDKLAALVGSFATTFPAHEIHVVDTRGTLQRAAAGTSGPNADWVNEIHPTSAGYAKLRARWQPVLDGFPRLDPI